jgi:tetratricopeptide (TPR) repeat protein
VRALALVEPPRETALRRWLGAAAAALLAAVVCWGGERSAYGAIAIPSGWRQQFIEAGRAYDAGRMPDAVRLYEDAVRSAPAAMELYFNLGNAYLRDGRLGPAVLNYRKAWRLAPRDPAIEANLRIALQEAGAAEADLSGSEILLTRLSEREWAVAATAAWWSTCLLLGLALLLRGRRWLFARAAVATALTVGVALLGLSTWRGFGRRPELVVLRGTQNALRAPLTAAPPLFPLPEGSIVRESGAQGEWVEVSSGQLTGWIRRSACAPVRP